MGPACPCPELADRERRSEAEAARIDVPNVGAREDHDRHQVCAVPWLVLFTAGDLRGADLEPWDSGLAPHYDVVHPELGELGARMLGTEHRVVPNPHHGTGG